MLHFNIFTHKEIGGYTVHKDYLSMLYEKNYQITISDKKKKLFHYFDYDERSSEINMEFEHLHDFFEIHILLSPEANHLIQGQRYQIKKHDIVLLSPQKLHKSEYPVGAPSKRLIINFSYSKSYLKDHSAFKTLLDIFYEHDCIYRFDSIQHNEVFSILNKIYLTSKQPISNELKEMLIQNYFLEFLYTLQNLKTYNTYTPDKIEDELKNKIYMIAAYIHKNYDKPLSLNMLSKEFYISSFYLSHQFKRITGYALIHYIQMTRIRNAQYALLHSHEKIIVIAENCGFTSSSQFNRVFLRICGVSPSEYRKNRISTTGNDFFNLD